MGIVVGLMTFASTETARDILSKRYYMDGETEPEHIVRRIANHIALAEQEELRAQYADRFYELIMSGDFVPSSPCVHNAGRPNGSGLFACFVIGMEDSLDSITAAKSDAMAITKFGGGWGVGLSKLRPKGSRVSGSTHGVAGGPVGFWETLSYDMRTMTQGGFRDAACMATMAVNHPDIYDFITAKNPINSVVRLLNLDSISDDPEGDARRLIANDRVAAASETYMSNFNISVLATDEFMLKATGESNDGVLIRLSHPASDVESIANAPELLDTIATGMWENGEPGLLFIDKIRERTKYNPEEIHATNPCGEQALPPNGSCCLGSINLSNFVESGKLNTNRLTKVIRIAVRFLDNMITLNVFPTGATREWSLHNRSIGLGVMGWADALVKMNLPYDSDAAVDKASLVASLLRKVAESESISLAEEKGGGIWDGRRNNVLLSIAPTGSISLLAGCSPGIEPPFSDRIVRTDKTGTHEIVSPLAGNRNFRKVADIHWSWTIKHVAAFSSYVDNSISYTVNLPNASTVSDVKQAIVYAWEMGCNGITIYRDGSRVRQVLNTQSLAIGGVEWTARPDVLEGKTYKFSARVNGEKKSVYVTVNRRGGKLFEVFVLTPQVGNMEELQAITTATRLSSLLLRYGTPPTEVVKQLRRIEGVSILSVQSAIANAIEKDLAAVDNIYPVCPECDSKMTFNGGCSYCESCGHTVCL